MIGVKVMAMRGPTGTVGVSASISPDESAVIMMQTRGTRPVKDMTGEVFGSFTVTSYAGYKLYNKTFHHHWVVRCNCGAEKEYARTRFTQIKSCGCTREKSAKCSETRRKAALKAWCNPDRKPRKPRKMTFRRWSRIVSPPKRKRKKWTPKKILSGFQKWNRSSVVVSAAKRTRAHECYASDREHRIAWSRKYRAGHKGILKVQRKAYMDTHVEERRTYEKKYRVKNKKRVQATEQRCRARKQYGTDHPEILAIMSIRQKIRAFNTKPKELGE